MIYHKSPTKTAYYFGWGNLCLPRLRNSRDFVTYENNSSNCKLSKIAYGNGFYVIYVYDELDNVKEVWYNGTKAYGYTYTAYGQLYRFDNLIDGTSTIYEYDPTGRLVHFTEFDSSAMVNELSSLIDYYRHFQLIFLYYLSLSSLTKIPSTVPNQGRLLPWLGYVEIIVSLRQCFLGRSAY